MTKQELVNELVKICDEFGKKKEKKVGILLFGVRYAKEIEKGIESREFSLQDIVSEAKIGEKDTYGTEIKLGMQLAKYVREI